MKDKFTLITCLGTGVYEEGDKGGYRSTTYDFGDKMLTYSVFSEALLEYYKDKIAAVIIIGTTTSSWDALVPESNNDNMDFYFNIHEELNNGISDESLKRLQVLLSNYYGFEFSLFSHSAELNDYTKASIENVYLSIYQHIVPKTKLILDITNGMRYMPIMTYQVLQYNSIDYNESDIRILYGEYNKNDKISHVRDISAVWSMADLGKQLYAFESTFDGILLGAKLKSLGHERLGNWVMGFSDMVKKNYVLQIRQATRELGNILKKEYSQKDESSQPAYLSRVLNMLSDFYSQFELIREQYNDELSEYALLFSSILDEHGLSTQSIIALKEALDVRIKERFDPEKIMEYVEDLTRQDYYTKVFKPRCKELGIYEYIAKLRRKRNTIAHAGTEKINSNLVLNDCKYREFKNYVDIAFREILQ